MPFRSLRHLRWFGQPAALIVLWLLAFIAIPIWSRFDPPGWDVTMHRSTLRSLRAGHDPYADAMAVQRLFHSQLALHPNAAPPYSYVYSPITLPLLRVVAALPGRLTQTVYWTIYTLAVLTLVWFGLQARRKQAESFIAYLAPAAAFFPGLAVNETVISGNVAFILYGLMLATALRAWRTRRWRWFYLAVLAASCFKAPFLSLLAIPVLSARKQWLPAAATAIAGLALFAVQSLIWPSLFLHYLQAVELQFSYNHDFGCSPAGLFSEALYHLGIPYSPAALIFYLCYALPLFALLLHLSRRFLRGAFSLQQWMPLLLLGVILLNPRIMAYDAAPLALPMGLIGWRFLRALTAPGKAVFVFSLAFAVANCCAVNSLEAWKLTEGVLLVVFFAAGSYTLLSASPASGGPASSTPAASASARLHPSTSALDLV